MNNEILYKRSNLMRGSWERKYALLLRALLNRQFRAVAKGISESNYTDPSLAAVKDEDIEKVFVNLYQVVGTEFARDAYKQKKAWEDDEALEDRWEQYMRDYAKRKAGARIVSITTMTKEQIRRIIGAIVDQATADGLGAAETARLIKKELIAQGEAINTWRSLRIARTEVMTASNTGSLQGAKDLGVPMDKIWIATLDERTRDSHAAMNGDRVDINEKFDNGMDGPGDPAGGASEVVNCRCSIAFSVKR